MSEFSGWDDDGVRLLFFYYISGLSGLNVDSAGVARDSLEKPPGVS